jgi:nucleoside-diphosphate-sugar epimerase
LLQIYAEKAAFDFIKHETPNFDLVVINPPLVFGPAPRHLSSLNDLNTSNQRIRDMIQAKNKEMLPPTGPIFICSDVRDVAAAHVKALDVPEASGQRFFVVGSYFSNKMIADIIRESHPEMESKLPPVDSADDMPAEIYGFNNEKSRDILGISYRDLKTCVIDTLDSMAKM